MSGAPRVLIVPGLRNHVADHWQTLLAAELPRTCTVAPLEHDALRCAGRVRAIDQALAAIDGPVLIVAHSAGAIMVAHWAHTARTAGAATRRVLGALLAAPADVDTPMPAGYPTREVLDGHGWLPIPRAPLPFPSILAASSNDPLMRLERARGLARDWGSRLVELGPVGHLNPASGHGDWPQARPLLQELLAMCRTQA